MTGRFVIVAHLARGRQSIASYEDQNVDNLTNDVIESDQHPDGSCLVVFSTNDALLRFRIEQQVPGCTVFPPHFSPKPIGARLAALVAHHGVTDADTMEDALVKVTEAHGHFAFHPHAL